ncbi:MAG: DUF2007 domain-containing protein [Actinomycetota bacterium]|nr:DUF2007 domain-containing protein [Actinomycetota bacterium]
MSDLAVLEQVSSEGEAQLVCSVLEGAGIQCYHRPTNQGVGAMDGVPTGGRREIVVRGEDLERAREVLELQRRVS